MQLDSPTLDLLAIAGASAGVLALLLALAAHLRLRRLRVRLLLLQGRGTEESFVDAVSRHVAESEDLRADLSEACTQLEATRLGIADAIRRVAVVRFDAFGDMGGRVSFSAALLDDAGDGLVITSINGRNETRTYAKGVIGGHGQQALSPEEEEAITLAGRSPVPRSRGADDDARRSAGVYRADR